MNNKRANYKVTFRDLKLKYILPVASISLMIWGFSGCYYDSQEYMFPELPGNCDTINVTYSGSIQPMLSNYCYSCHDNANATAYGNQIKLENYSDVLTKVMDKTLYPAVAQTGKYPMPKNSSKLSQCSINSLKIWIDAGAPNN